MRDGGILSKVIYLSPSEGTVPFMVTFSANNVVSSEEVD
jgi:hypothetical protein